jgi:uncharacterized membrane protein YsdA (DUF1294 family)
LLVPILIVLAVLNLITFLAFGLDKWRARRGTWRTPEATLLGLSWLGGFLGGWLAMRVFRHKTIKGSFRVKMLMVSVLNPIWVLGYWLIETGELSF